MKLKDISKLYHTYLLPHLRLYKDQKLLQQNPFLINELGKLYEELCIIADIKAVSTDIFLDIRRSYKYTFKYIYHNHNQISIDIIYNIYWDMNEALYRYYQIRYTFNRIKNIAETSNQDTIINICIMLHQIYDTLLEYLKDHDEQVTQYSYYKHFAIFVSEYTFYQCITIDKTNSMIHEFQKLVELFSDTTV